MKIRVLSSVLVGGVWHEPGVGNYSPELAQHLIDIGAAEKYNTKVIEQIQTKEVKAEKKPLPEKLSSVSRPAQASRKRTVRKSDKQG